MNDTRTAKYDPQKDIAALAADTPRQAAIDALLAGRIDDYLVWINGDGYIAAWGKPRAGAKQALTEIDVIPLDEALTRRIEDYSEDFGIDIFRAVSLDGSPTVSPFQAIPYFRASALEIILRSGSLATLELLLKKRASPEKRFADGRYGKRGGGWKSLYLRSSTVSRKDEGYSALTQWARTNTELEPLIMLACLLGNFEAATMIQRYGWAPNDQWTFFDLSQPIFETINALAENPHLEDRTAAIFDIPIGTLTKAADWLQNRGRMAGELEEIFGNREYADIRDKAMALLDQGTPVGYYPLGIATEQNDLEMLRRLFDSGGDPNAVYKTGWSMLGRLNSKKLSPEALQIWLDRGASPINHMDNDSPYGLSALTEWAWEGRLDLIRQAVDNAAGTVQLTYKRNVQQKDDGPEVMQAFSPLLATAVSKGHVDLAAWLIHDRGLSLDDWDDYTEGEWKPCHTFGTPEFLADLNAVLKR